MRHDRDERHATREDRVTREASGSPAPSPRVDVESHGDTIRVFVPMTFRRRGGRKEIVLPRGVRQVPQRDAFAPTALQTSLARAYMWQKMIDSGEAKSAREISRKYKVDPMCVSRALRLCSLAPRVVQGILAGEIGDMDVVEMGGEIPMVWEEQRSLILATSPRQRQERISGCRR